jgi:hypothetical protein
MSRSGPNSPKLSASPAIEAGLRFLVQKAPRSGVCRSAGPPKLQSSRAKKKCVHSHCQQNHQYKKEVCIRNLQVFAVTFNMSVSKLLPHL